jgi:Tfp pilus assembly protein PilX
MVVALLIMAVLTILGISAVSTSNIDIMIAANDRLYKRNFYRAEAASMEGIQIIEDSDAVDLCPGLMCGLVTDGTTDMEVASNWDTGNSLASAATNARSAVVLTGVAGGASLDMAAPSQLFEYHVYGTHNDPDGSVLQIVVGYRKRM